MSILAEIFAHKKLEIEQARQARPLAEVQAAAADAVPALDFGAALQGNPARSGLVRGEQVRGGPIRAGSIRLIAEVKAASPSRGVIRADFDPLGLAAVYAANGAAAISVLTDEHYFKGSLEYLRQIRRSPVCAGVPLLRKDFLCDPYQVYEARAAGADAVLLIAAALESAQMAELQGLAHSLGMAALVEVHNQAELQNALQIAPRLVGINNRDLHTFQVSLETTLALRPQIPAGVCVVSESGIHQAADIARLAQAGINAVLVGEALVAAPDTAAKVRELSGLSLSEKGRV